MWKDAQYHLSSGNCKFKRDHYTPLEYLKSKRVTALNALECVEQQELSFFAGDNVNDTATLEDNFTDSFKTKHILTT